MLFASARDITGRKQNEEALLVSQARYISLFGAIADAVYIHAVLEDGAPGKFLEVNEAACRQTGYTREELLGMTPLQLDAPDSGVDLGSINQRLLAGEPVNFEQVHLAKDGRRIPVEIHAHLFMLNGSPTVISLARDITERKRAEDSLRKLSLAVEQSSSSIIITGIDANIEYVNEGFVKVTGYSRAEVVGQNPRILQSGKTPKASYDDLWAHLTRGEMWKGEFINRRKDGSEYIEAILISPVRQTDGRVTNYLAIKEDITERKLMEQALQQSEANISALVEHSPIAMIVGVGVDADEKIMMMNQKFTQLFGYTLKDVPDVRHWWPLAYPDEQYREELKAEWIGKVEKSTQSHEDIEPMETTATCKDGSIRQVRISLATTGSRNIITFEDLTEHKLAESELVEQLDELRRWHDATVGREMRTIELKHEVNELLGQAGQPPRYPSAKPYDKRHPDA